MTRRLRSGQTLIASLALLLIVALIGSGTAAGTQQDFITALVSATIVYGLYVFVGNSGVISFGHISFVAIGAFAAGVMTIPTGPKHLVLPGLWSFIAQHSVSNFVSLLIAAGLGAIVAMIVGLPLMRLSGIAAGIATFAVLEITNNILQQWTKIGPGPTTLSLVPVSTGIWQALLGAAVAAVVAFTYQSSRRGRLLRASREDPAAAQAVGVSITRERLVAFGLSGALAGLGGGPRAPAREHHDRPGLPRAHVPDAGHARHRRLGEPVGRHRGSARDQLAPVVAVGGGEHRARHLLFAHLPNGASDLILGVIMAAMLLFRPSGITGGAESARLRQTFARAPRFQVRARGETGGRSGASTGRGEIELVMRAAEKLSALRPGGGHRTLAERAFATLHEAIVTGVLAPGERLPIQELAEVLEMSPMPIREALRLLDSVGLVENIPHRGARVTELSIDDLREVTRRAWRSSRSPSADAAENFTTENAERATQALSAHVKAYKQRDPGLVWSTHTAFHFALYDAANSRWMSRLIHPLWETSERYRFAMLSVRQNLDKRRLEHERILQACVAHDPEAAARELHNHLARTANLVANRGWGRTCSRRSRPSRRRRSRPDRRASGAESRRGRPPRAARRPRATDEASRLGPSRSETQRNEPLRSSS